LDVGAEELPPKALCELATCYYDGQSLEYTMRLEEDGSSTPLLMPSGFLIWLCYQLLLAPEATLRSLNKRLNDADQPLMYPQPDKQFKYTTIPDECLPKVQQSTIDNIIRISEEWNVSRTKIIDTHEVAARRHGRYARLWSLLDDFPKEGVKEAAKDECDASRASEVELTTGHQAAVSADTQMEPLMTRVVPQQPQLNELQQMLLTHQRKTAMYQQVPQQPQLNELQQMLLAHQQETAMYQQISLQQQRRAAENVMQMRLQRMEYASMQHAADAMLCSTIIQHEASMSAFATMSRANY